MLQSVLRVRFSRTEVTVDAKNGKGRLVVSFSKSLTDDQVFEAAKGYADRVANLKEEIKPGEAVPIKLNNGYTVFVKNEPQFPLQLSDNEAIEFEIIFSTTVSGEQIKEVRNV